MSIRQDASPLVERRASQITSYHLSLLPPVIIRYNLYSHDEVDKLNQGSGVLQPKGTNGWMDRQHMYIDGTHRRQGRDVHWLGPLAAGLHSKPIAARPFGVDGVHRVAKIRPIYYAQTTEWTDSTCTSTGCTDDRALIGIRPAC